MRDATLHTFAELTEGQEAHFTVDVTQELVERFAELSGDTNPLHMDATYATGTPLGGPVVHGMLCGSFFSRLVGMHLPGRYALYMSQTLSFRKPCRIGMRVRVEGTIRQKVDATKSIVLVTRVVDSATEVCLVDGEAMVALLA